LAGTEAGWREAREGLSGLARRSPNNNAVQLAYAQVLTYREETRAQGLEILRRLSGQPDSQGAATAAWRQALTWIGAGPDAVRPLEGYLQQFPNDAEIQRRLDEARNPPQAAGDLVGEGRAAAWRAFNANRLRDAEERFAAVLAVEPNDADGLGGLGLIRLRQGNRVEARRYLEAAIAADPSRRSAWERALQGTTQQAAPARGQSGGAPGPDIQSARNLVEAGNFSQAEPLLARIIARNGGDRPDAEALLGDIALRQGSPDAAEQRYRAALARRGNFGAALSGLASSLQAQGKFAEAEEVFRRLGQSSSPQLRADALRAEAQRTDDPAAAAALLRTAIQNEPNNPWPRLDLARLMARSGQGAAARQLMEESVAGRSTPDAIHAAAIFATEQGRPGDAVRLLERVPAGVRTADQNRMLVTSRVQAEVRSAAALATQGRRQEARQRLLAIASRPDPTGEAGPAVVRALNAMNDPQAAQQAARMASIASRGQSPTAQLSAAGALLEAGLDQEAAVKAQGLESSRLSADQRRAASGLQAGLAIRQSDQLNRQGDQATAFEVLAPTLRQDPQNPAANLALARLYQGARETDQAQRVAEAVLSRNPRDTDARQAAMDAAIATRDWSRAEALLAEGRALMPNDARIPMLEARLARAWGDQRRAQAALQQAAQLRRQQIGTDTPAGILGGGTVPQATLPQQPMSGDNPFRRVPLAGQGSSLQGQLISPGMQGRQFQLAQATSPVAPVPADPLLGEITRQLQEVREEAAPRVTPAFGLRTRSGDAGIDRLTETHAGAEASVAMPGIGGRLTARAAAVNADIGSISSDYNTLRRFGTVPTLGFFGGATLPPSFLRDVANRVESSQSGVALGLAYARPNFSIDVGSTPIGFNQSTIIGGIEVAPEIGDGVRLRLTAERRAMMDSLLSWGGLRDPLTNQEWGGVTRTGGRAQLEFTSGDINFYVAGGYYRLEGENVRENSRIEAGAGVQVPIWRSATDELVVGADLVYFAYENNLRYFTFGHGGYFSPQSFMALNVPVDYRGRSGNLSYRLGATIGLATFTEDRTAVYPNNPTDQQDLVNLAASGANVDAFYPGQTKTGLTGGLRGDIEYMVTPQLRIGGALRFDQAADWSEARGIVYARYRFDR
jgi:Tfp pilus assembly protein PilF